MSVGEEQEQDGIELTDREMAIINDQDPDAIVNDTPEGDEPVADSTDGEVSDDPVTEDVVSEDNSADNDSSSWLDDDAVELGSSYGLTKEDMQSFASQDEFNRAARLIDRQFATAGRQTQEAPQAPAAPAQPAQQQPQVAQPSGQQQAPEEISLDPQRYIDAGYDDDTVALVKAAKAMREELDSLKPAFETYVQQQQYQAQVQAQENRHKVLADFHDALDEIDPDIYGVSVDDDGNPIQLSAEAEANRQKAWNEAHIIATGMVETGQQPPSMKILMKRATRYAFADAIEKKNKAEYQRKVAEQSKRRRGSSGMTNRGTEVAAPVVDGDDSSSLANHPDLVALWNKMQDENGAS